MRIEVRAHVRYWEDSDVNGIEDTENGDNIPCKDGEFWCPIIDSETGIIQNWEQGKTANIHYKVCDECSWKIFEDGELWLEQEDEYVPKFLYPKENGFNDYIIMDIDENGKINNFKY